MRSPMPTAAPSALPPGSIRRTRPSSTASLRRSRRGSSMRTGRPGRRLAPGQASSRSAGGRVRASPARAVLAAGTCRSSCASRAERSSPRGRLNKLYDSPRLALGGLLTDGMTIMSGGFGLVGNPESLIPEIRASGVKDLVVISNNAGADGFGLWHLLESRQVRKMISSYIGENKLFEQQYLAGELELEFNP